MNSRGPFNEKMRSYADRVRIKWRFFPMTESRRIAEQAIADLLQVKSVEGEQRHDAVQSLLEAAVNDRLEPARHEVRTIAITCSLTAMDELLFFMQKLHLEVTRLPPSSKAKINSMMKAVQPIGVFDTEVFQDFIVGLIACLEDVSPRAKAERILEIFRSHDRDGLLPETDRWKVSPRCNRLWEQTPHDARRGVERWAQKHLDLTALQFLEALPRQLRAHWPRLKIGAPLSNKRHFVDTAVNLMESLNLGGYWNYDANRGQAAESFFQKICRIASEGVGGTTQISRRQIANAKRNFDQPISKPMKMRQKITPVISNSEPVL